MQAYRLGSGGRGGSTTAQKSDNRETRKSDFSREVRDEKRLMESNYICTIKKSLEILYRIVLSFYVIDFILILTKFIIRPEIKSILFVFNFEF